MSDAEWQGAVKCFLQVAQIVFVHGSLEGDGFSWELSQVIQLVSPERVVVIVPQNRFYYKSFVDMANRHLPHRIALPPLEDGNNIAGVVRFSKAWRPQYVPFKRIRRRLPFWKRSRRRLIAAAVRPVMSRLVVQEPTKSLVLTRVIDLLTMTSSAAGRLNAHLTQKIAMIENRVAVLLFVAYWLLVLGLWAFGFFQ